MRRVVVDPGVVVSSLITPSGTTADVLDAWRAGAFELVVSEHLLAELEDVLRRPRLSRYLTGEDVDELLAAVRDDGLLFSDPADPPAVSRDPKDGYLVALARAAGANVIVSGDRHLLELDIRPPVLTPRELLELLQPS